MRTEMVIRIQVNSENGHSKAIKAAAAVAGVESVTIAGEDRNLLLVIGVGIDSNRITKKLKQKVGHAEVVELHTVDAEDELAGGDHQYPYRYHPSPSPGMYKLAPARDAYYAGARDHRYYSAGSAGGARDYYNYGGGGGGRGGGGGGGRYPPAQYQQHGYQAYPSAANTHTVVHHSYSDDPNNCSVM